MQKTWEDVVKRFNTCPYLFIGSGLTRRYLGLPDWKGLLEHFCSRLSGDEFAYAALKQRAENDFGEMGNILESRFNDRWFEDENFRTKSERISDFVKNGVSPFKAEISEYIRSFKDPVDGFCEEIETLREICNKNISGIITTNYDLFLEKNVAPDYKVYVGQEELIFSSIQAIGEIFKIHGCITKPESIVLTRSDYLQFDKKCAYLAAKLMTVFVEYPVIFIGYSISDANIRKILSAIVDGLSPSQINQLTDRFVFIKWTPELGNEIRISDHSKDIGGITIPMTLVETSSFLRIFQALQGKRDGYSIRFLRYMKEAVCDYVMTAEPTKNMLVMPYDQSIPEHELILYVGTNKEYAKHGLVGIDLEQWYKEIIFDGTIKFNVDDILEYGYPMVVKRAAGNLLPVFKFLSKSKKSHKNIKVATSYDDLLNNDIIRQRAKMCNGDSVSNIVNDSKLDDNNKARYIAALPSDKIKIDELEGFIKFIFNKYPDILSSGFWNKNFSTNLRRIIRIYDFLRYGNDGGN